VKQLRAAWINMAFQTLNYFTPRITRRPIDWRMIKRVLILMAVLVPVEYACARLAYHTIGEVISAAYVMLVLANIVPLAFVIPAPRVARVLLILLALLIIPYQLFLGVRWWRVHREAQRIVEHAQNHKAGTGGYPADLSGYVFRDPGVQEFISYDGGTNVMYSVGSSGTLHWYDEDEGWLYYPD
jgi:hypothetical protein